MKNKLVSILIPVYNRENLIEETVRSAINQTYKNIEIIVVDNKSTDNTWGILEKLASEDERIKIFQNETNIGPVRNWKRCIDEARGEYVKILWSDDLIAPEFIEKTLPFLVNNSEIGFVFTKTVIFNDVLGEKVEAYCVGETGIYETKFFIEGSLLGNLPVPVSPGNALFRKKDLEKNLIIDIPNKIGSDFKMHAIGNDVLIYLLTANDHPKLAFINETLSFFRSHKGSITISSDRSKVDNLYNIAKAYFVQSYVTDEKLIKKFNTKLLIFFIRYGKNTGIKKIQDFYINQDKVDINYSYLLKLLIKKLLLKSYTFFYLIRQRLTG